VECEREKKDKRKSKEVRGKKVGKSKILRDQDGRRLGGTTKKILLSTVKDRLDFCLREMMLGMTATRGSE